MSGQRATAVLVNHDSGHRLGPLLDALEQEVGAIIVVDNASTDGSLAFARARPAVTVVSNRTNVGFAAAANQGAAAAQEEWLLFVNPDVEIGHGDVARLLRDVLPEVAAVAPLQVDERGRVRAETGGYEPSLSRYLLWALVPARFHGRWGPWLAPRIPDRDFELDWLSGAFLGVRRELFERLGGFDERFFLYHEDVEFARRVRRAGYRLLCRPGVRLYHEVAHGSPERRANAGLRAVESLALDFEGWRRRPLGLVLGLGYGLRAALGSGTGKTVARAALPMCSSLIRGRVPRIEAGTGPAGRPQSLLRRLADPGHRRSTSSRFRARRFALFVRLVASMPRPLSILDVGGTERFWESTGFDRGGGVDITLLNLRASPTTLPQVHGVAGDARAMDAFEDGRFDVAFSNSVLEHVGGYEDQRRMAREMRRVARAYFVQVPNRRFPLEPHVVFPFFQYLPISTRVFLLRHVRMGNREGRIRDRHDAEAFARSIRLPTRREMSALFPGASIYEEKVLGLTKSFVAFDGFPS